MSFGLAILGFFFLFEGHAVALHVVGGMFIAMGFIFLFMFSRRKQRLLWIYRNTVPIPMQMKLDRTHDSDSTNYVATLIWQDNNISEQWKTDLYPPSCDVQSFLNNEIQVQVYVDPTNNNPAVISTTMGLLWVMAGSGAVQKLDKSQ